MNEYRQGFRDGFKLAMMQAKEEPFLGFDISEVARQLDKVAKYRGTKRKVRQSPKQSPKQKLLTQMTKKKWDKYKKGRGKKTYVEIRGEVSRSQAFKKKAKRL